ncbi:LLM class F420-dependent oxidoreductase [Candidatus Binatia bacterium]|nr:LLM class F420-dependent oxidoreductase [Candidatus Binatia bacterium]
MQFGLMMFATDYSIRPDDLARAAEERGFESLWFPEHTHIPASRVSPWPGGGPLPEDYWHTHDLFVALTMAAAVTTKLKVASGICLLIQRDPIITAKEVATLDALSNGRLIFGIGGGWNAEEMANHGTAFKTRWELLRERVLAMKEIWARDEAEYHGRFVDFDKIWSWPKPAQKPHPPILLGGHSAQVRQRVADYCDGWLPLGLNAEAVVAGIDDVRARAEKRGRDPRTLQCTIFGAAADADAIECYRKAGVDRVTLGLPAADRDTVLRVLDRHAAFVGSLG